LLQSWLHHNAHAQLALVSGLARDKSAGHALLEGLRGSSVRAVWAASHILAAALELPSAQQSALELCPILLDILFPPIGTTATTTTATATTATTTSSTTGATRERLLRLSRLRVLWSWCECVNVVQALVAVSGRIPQLVESVLSPASDVHVAAHAAMLLSRM
jgi:hypothetical protein